MELRQCALAAFCETDPLRKVASVLALHHPSDLPLDCAAQLPAPPEPGRPALPLLVHPQQVPRRSPFTPEGHCALVHSIAHIEFNAINIVFNEDILLWVFFLNATKTAGPLATGEYMPKPNSPVSTFFQYG